MFTDHGDQKGTGEGVLEVRVSVAEAESPTLSTPYIMLDFDCHGPSTIHGSNAFCAVSNKDEGSRTKL